MLEGKYKVSLNTPIGPINGVISLLTNGNSVQGIIETMGMKSSFYGSKIANEKCKFNGNLNSPFGQITYDAICTVNNNSLVLEASTSQGKIKISGTRIWNRSYSFYF